VSFLVKGGETTLGFGNTVIGVGTSVVNVNVEDGEDAPAPELQRKLARKELGSRHV